MSVVVENLCVRYGDTIAVDGVSLTAPTGKVTVVLGPNGAGKTSTIEVCEGFRTASSGSVRVLGLDPVADRAQLVTKMGVMLQGGGVYPSARVRDVIAHFCRLHDRGVVADDLIDQLGLSRVTRSTWRRLSGGEQQRVSLALALAARPEVAFLDEPTSGVDIEGRDVIRSIVSDLSTQGTTVVLATHEMSEAERLADHVVMFGTGRVVAEGSPASLIQQRNRLTFTSDESVNTAELGAFLGAVVAHYGAGMYEVAHAPTTQLAARITSWLADKGHPLHGVDMGHETLEDAYRRLTGGAS